MKKKNIKVILSLIGFFPIGLFLMYNETNWSKRSKIVITGLFAIISTLLIAGNLWKEFLFVHSLLLILVALIYLIYTFWAKKKKLTPILLMIFGASLIGITAPLIDAEQKQLEAIELAEQQAEEKREEELQKEKYLKSLEETWINDLAQVNEQLAENEAIAIEAKEAVELAKAEPTQTNYDKASNLLEKLLTKNQDLEKELEEIKPAVEANEAALVDATEALRQAEDDKTRSSYDQASSLVLGLAIPNKTFEKRLEKLDEEILLVEEEERIKAENEQKEKEKQQEAQQNQNTTGEKEYVDENGNPLIKGSKNGIYHVPGSTYYNRTTNPAALFKTVSEAKNAGYRAPKR